MSSLNKTGLARRTVLALALVGGALASGACQPLYNSTVGGESLQSELQAIEVKPVSDRLGHYIVDELTFGLNGTGTKVPAKYRLTILVKERSQSPLIDTVVGRASSATVLVDAYYELARIGKDELVTKGSVFVSQSYDRTSQRLSNVRAARDAEIRDAKELARQIKDRLALTLTSR